MFGPQVEEGHILEIHTCHNGHIMSSRFVEKGGLAVITDTCTKTLLRKSSGQYLPLVTGFS